MLQFYHGVVCHRFVVEHPSQAVASLPCPPSPSDSVVTMWSASMTTSSRAKKYRWKICEPGVACQHWFLGQRAQAGVGGCCRGGRGDVRGGERRLRSVHSRRLLEVVHGFLYIPISVWGCCADVEHPWQDLAQEVAVQERGSRKVEHRSIAAAAARILWGLGFRV